MVASRWWTRNLAVSKHMYQSCFSPIHAMRSFAVLASLPLHDTAFIKRGRSQVSAANAWQSHRVRALARPPAVHLLVGHLDIIIRHQRCSRRFHYRPWSPRSVAQLLYEELPESEPAEPDGAAKRDGPNQSHNTKRSLATRSRVSYLKLSNVNSGGRAA